MCNVVIADDNYRKVTEYVTSQVLADQQMICDHNLGNTDCLQHYPPCQIVSCMYKYLLGQNLGCCLSIASMSFHI